MPATRDPQDDAASIANVHAAVDAGVNLFDIPFEAGPQGRFR